MKVLMLNPPFLRRYSRQSRSPCVTKGGTFYYPYFLAYATGALEKEGFEVKLLDAVARDFSRGDTIRFAEEFDPGLVVIDTSTPSIYNDVKVASEIKEALPETHVNLVGTHPTALPEETFAMGKIDSICRWEYDHTLVDLANALEGGSLLNSVDGLSYRENGKIVHNKARGLIKNLDELPFVSHVYKKHLNIRDYFYASLTYPQVTILTARGCPYNCSFCNSPYKNSYRARSVENVVAEFEYIKKELPEVKEVMIEDETFPANKKRTLEFCEQLIKNDIDIKWSCNARVNTDYETLKAMHDAGCRLLCVGFESPNQFALDEINKRTTKDAQIKFMQNARNLGLLINGCFILGLPGDDTHTVKETIEFAKELNSDTAQFYPLMVYPGTRAYKWAKENGFLTTEDYSKWIEKNGMHTTTVSRPYLTNEELVKICDSARKEFYLRPTYIFYKIFQSIINPVEGIRNIKSAKTFFRHLAKP